MTWSPSISGAITWAPRLSSAQTTSYLCSAGIEFNESSRKMGELVFAIVATICGLRDASAREVMRT